MINSIPYSPVSFITNRIKVKADNSISSTASNSLYFIHEVCLVLTQYLYKICNNLIYNIYVINNVENDIYNIKLEDILPQGAKFVSTFVEHGQYKQFKEKIYYDISIIKAHSFCKITLNLRSTTPGKKINTIKVIGKESKCTVHNPCECMECKRTESEKK